MNVAITICDNRIGENIIIIKKVNHDLEITLFTDSNKTIKITDIFILEKPNYTINFNYNNNTTLTQIKIDNEIKYYKYNFSFGRLNYNFVSVYFLNVYIDIGTEILNQKCLDTRHVKHT